jgi:ferric-dicitrate binding protein FerR (iron transport regulator)
MTEERLHELMVTVVDGVASPAEREELMSYLVRRPDLRVEFEAQQALKASTDGWMRRLEADLAAAAERGAGRRHWRGLGLGLLILGVAVLSVGAGMELAADADVPLSIKVGLALLAIGFAALLLPLVRARFLSGRRDPYDDIIL